MNSVLTTNRTDLAPSTTPRVDHRTTNIVIFLLAYTVLSGALRKWFFATSSISNVMLMMQLLLPYLLLFIRPLRLDRFLQYVLIVYALLLVALGLNPMNLTPYHGVLGWVIHFSFWLGLFVLIGSRPYLDWARLDRVFLALLAIQLVLGVAQYSVPNTHWLNIVGSGEANDGHAGDSVRVAGTFTHFSGYSAYASFCAMYVWRLFVRDEGQFKILGIFAAVLVVTLMSGSRTALLFAGVFPAFGAIQQSSLERIIKFVGVSFIGLILGLTLFSGTPFVTRMIDNVTNRIEYGLQTDESSERVGGMLHDVVNFRGDYPLFGTGLGGTYQGAIAIWGVSHYNLQYGYYEEELERIILEGGFVLLFAKFILFAILIARMRIPVILSLLSVILTLLFSGTVFFTYHLMLNLLGFYLIHDAYLERVRYRQTT